MYTEKRLGAKAISRELNKTARRLKASDGRALALSKLKNPAYYGVLQKSFSNVETITVLDVYPLLRSELMMSGSKMN